MTGFYFRSRRFRESTIPEYTLSFTDKPYVSDILQNEGLCLFKDRHAHWIQSGDYTLYSIGTLVYRKSWGEKALAFILKDLQTGRDIINILGDVKGQFCLLIHTPHTVFIITDKIGSFPVYRFENDKEIAISNILPLLAKDKPLSFNYQGISEYLCFDYCINCTFFNEIKLLPEGTISTFGKENKTLKYHDLLKGIRYNSRSSLKEASLEAYETLKENLSFLNPADKIVADITGGFDTRTVAAVLKNNGIAFEGAICGEQVIAETRLAQQVAEKLGITMHADTTIPDRQSFESALLYHLSLTGGVPLPYHSTELIHYYETLKNLFDIHVTGFAGTELSTCDLPKLGLFSRRILFYPLYKKRFPWKDIFSSHIWKEEDYYKRLEEKISTLFEKLGTDSYEEAANYFIFATYSRNYHGALIGTHNTIMPFYSPFLESNYIRLMLETNYNLKGYHNIQRTLLSEKAPDISLISTSHGYNANTAAVQQNLSRKALRCLKDIGRRLSYEYKPLMNLKNALQSFGNRLNPMQSMAERQRSFWIEAVYQKWSENAEIFDIIDQQKLQYYIKQGQDVPKLLGKLIYLNTLFNQSRITSKNSIQERN